VPFSSIPTKSILIGLLEHFSQSFAALLAGWHGTPPAPGEFDHRHHAYEAMVEKYKNKGGAGVWHFALWTFYKTEPYVSANTRGNNVYDMEAVARFLSDLSTKRPRAVQAAIRQTTQDLQEHVAHTV
jgi:hypothetical protein